MLNVNHNNKMYVATYKEILLGFIVFCSILIILYPKSSLTKQVLAEQSNYDLSVLYLKNMLKNDPSNETLMLTLAKQAFQAKKKDLSFKLLRLLRNSPNREIREKAYQLSYKIAKEDYLYLKHKNKTTAFMQKYTQLQNIFNIIIKQNFYKESDIPRLYKESYFVNNKKDAYLLVQKLLKKRPHDIKYLSDAFYLSYKLKDYTQSMFYLDQLAIQDKQNRKKWFNESYFLLTKYFSYKEIESYIINHAKNSPYWSNKLISFYLQHKQYKKVSQLYMNQFQNTTSYAKRKKYWFKAIAVLQAGGELKAAVHLGDKYENYFIQDKQASIMLLKLYISANDLKRANRLSQKLLKIKG